MKYQYFSCLEMSWSVSRGRDTYGYNICRLDDSNTGKRYRCSGGGYDMQGTVFAQYLVDVWQNELQEFFKANQKDLIPAYTNRLKLEKYYGAFYDGASVTLDGACGLSCMINIAEAIGLEVHRTSNKKWHLAGFYIGKF